MDKIPRTKAVTRDMDDASEDIVEFLDKIKELDEEVFSYLDTNAYQQQAQDALLRVIM